MNAGIGSCYPGMSPRGLTKSSMWMKLDAMNYHAILIALIISTIQRMVG
ncbi:hypothetical protein P3T23_006248 [Paraburkholderia sp. GAS448]